MALIKLNFKSKCLAMQIDVTVIIPENEQMSSTGFNEKFKTLYLLHGLTNDSSIYTRYTNIERYASDKNLAVVMPSVHHSFYTDMKYGHPYFTFISEELPNFVRNLLPLSANREDNFVAGHSMGGYGTFKLALTKPEAFAAAASMSGVMDINYFLQDGVFEGFNPKSIYGDVKNLAGTENDLFYLLEKNVKNKVPLPKLFQICGTEDFLYESNIRFRDFANKLNVELTYVEKPGEHEWGFWEDAIKRIVEWLPLSSEAE